MGTEEDGPILTLARRLRSLGQPPSFTVLLSCIEKGQSYGEFVALVREYLPEQEGEILSRNSVAAQIAAFADRFEDDYFPLECSFRGLADNYADLTGDIPTVVMGFSWEDYHFMPDSSGAPGLLLLTYLIENPYGEEDGARLAIGEACAPHVPIELLRRVSFGGLALDGVHRLFDDTPYRALAHWGDILHSNTGNFFLDTTVEDLWDEGFPPWEREIVEQLTRQWRQAEEIQRQIEHLIDWLEENPPAHFREILDFLEERGGMMNGQS